MYSLVDEGYDVTVFGSYKALLKNIDNLYIKIGSGKFEKVTLKLLKKVFKTSCTVRLYEDNLGEDDWVFRLEKVYIIR